MATWQYQATQINWLVLLYKKKPIDQSFVTFFIMYTFSGRESFNFQIKINKQL